MASVGMLFLGGGEVAAMEQVGGATASGRGRSADRRSPLRTVDAANEDTRSGSPVQRCGQQCASTGSRSRSRGSRPMIVVEGLVEAAPGTEKDLRGDPDAELHERIAKHQREIEFWKAMRIGGEDGEGDLSGADTPPLADLDDLLPPDLLASVGVAPCGGVPDVRDPGFLVNMEPLPPPPPPNVRAERMVLEALKRRDSTIPPGCPALVAAAFANELDSVRWLLEMRSDPNMIGAGRASALWYMVANRNLDGTNVLLEALADPNHARRNAKGIWRSIMDMASQQGTPDAITKRLWSMGGRHGVRLPPRKRPPDTPMLQDQVAQKALPAPPLPPPPPPVSSLALVPLPAQEVFSACDSALAHPVGSVKFEPVERLARLAQLTDCEEPIDVTDVVPPKAEEDGSAVAASGKRPPLMRLGSAFAARSTFRKAYAKQLLPLCDEKPMLDFSAYSKRARSPSPSKRGRKAKSNPYDDDEGAANDDDGEDSADAQMYAGLEFRRQLRGQCPVLERARAQVAKEFFESRASFSSSSSSAKVAAKFPNGSEGRLKLKTKKEETSDPIEDPWGCALAATSQPMEDEEEDEEEEEDIEPVSAVGEDSAKQAWAWQRRPPWMKAPKKGTVKKDSGEGVPQRTRPARAKPMPKAGDRQGMSQDTELDLESTEAADQEKLSPEEAELPPWDSWQSPDAVAASDPCSNKGMTEPSVVSIVPGPKARSEDATCGSPSKVGLAMSKSFAKSWARQHVLPPSLVRIMPSKARPEGPPSGVVGGMSPSFIDANGSSSMQVDSDAIGSPDGWHSNCMTLGVDGWNPPREQEDGHGVVFKAPFPPPPPLAQGMGGMLSPMAKSSARQSHITLSLAPPRVMPSSPMLSPQQIGSASSSNVPRGLDTEVIDVDRLPVFSSQPDGDWKFNDTRLSEVQTRLIKQLAGGAARHDPARDHGASREQAKNSCLIDVRKLRFCHFTISPTFMNGKHRGLPVLSLLDSLHSGRSKPEELPPLLVMRSQEGLLEVVCGNRRLYCLKRFASEASVAVNSWCIVYDVMAQSTPRNLVMKYILAKTTEDGGSIRLRGA